MKKLLVLGACIPMVVGLGVASAAPGGGGGGGHTPVTVCHNVAHNPHEITVDSNSTNWQGHLNHIESGFDTEGACPSGETPPPAAGPGAGPAAGAAPAGAEVADATAGQAPLSGSPSSTG